MLLDQGLQVLLTCGSNFTLPSVAAKILNGSLYDKVSLRLMCATKVVGCTGPVYQKDHA